MIVGGEEYSCWGFVGALLNWEQVFLERELVMDRQSCLAYRIFDEHD
jgi:hypothetical protein